MQEREGNGSLSQEDEETVEKEDGPPFGLCSRNPVVLEEEVGDDMTHDQKGQNLSVESGNHVSGSSFFSGDRENVSRSHIKESSVSTTPRRRGPR